MEWLESTDMEPSWAIRRAVIDLARDLMRLDQRIFELLQRIALPTDVGQMWDLETAPSVAAELYGTLRCVKNDQVQEAIMILRAAAQKTEEQLREEFRCGWGQNEADTVPPDSDIPDSDKKGRT